MTVGVKAGIGISAAVIAITLGALAFLCFSRRRYARHRQRDGQNPRAMYISDPLPGSGRSFAPDDEESYRHAGGIHRGNNSKSNLTPASTLAPMSELEMMSRRYEDMVPRTKPVPYV